MQRALMYLQCKHPDKYEMIKPTAQCDVVYKATKSQVWWIGVVSSQEKTNLLPQNYIYTFSSDSAI